MVAVAVSPEEERLQALENRIAEVEDHTDALRLLPEKTADLRVAVEDVRAATRGVRHEVDGLRELIVERFNRVDSDHEKAQARAEGIDWKLILTFVGVAVVPIVVAIITTGH